MLHFKWSVRGITCYCRWNSLAKVITELCDSSFPLKAVIGVYKVSLDRNKQECYLAHKTCVSIYQCPMMHIHSKTGKFSTEILCSISLTNYF